jgi:hypothetical protein
VKKDNKFITKLWGVSLIVFWLKQSKLEDARTATICILETQIYLNNIEENYLF